MRRIHVEQHQACFETLANELRLKILQLLEKESLNVSAIAEQTGAERSRVSHALQILRNCQLVTTQKHGREIRYAVNRDTPLFKEHRGDLFTLMEAHARTNCTTCVKCGKAPFQ